MCGIAGFIYSGDSEGVSHPATILARMTDAIRHRGPDDSGFYTDGRVFLGHRRLSIIDLAGGPPADVQRRRQLLDHLQRRDLQSRRRCGRSWSAPATATQRAATPKRSCTPTSSTAPDCAARGSAACSRSRIWDADARTLFCARDRLGIKPFYYYWDGRLFAFASEIKALLEHPAISAGLERIAAAGVPGVRLHQRRAHAVLAASAS